jgi:hypothetical protein
MIHATVETNDIESAVLQGREAERRKIIDLLMDTRQDFFGGVKNGRDYDGWLLMVQGIEAGICNIVFESGGYCPICKESH